MAESPTFQIPKDVIEPIIQAHIAAAVTAALSGREAVVTAAVNRVLTMKVDNDGKPSTSSYHALNFVQWLMQDAIRKAAIEAVREALNTQGDAIKKAIAKELTKQTSPLAKQMVESFARMVSNEHMLRYNLAITVSEKER